jgi:arginase
MIRKVAMVGVPMSLGIGHRGVDLGPTAVRIAGLQEKVVKLGLKFEDRGDVEVPQPASREPLDPSARFAPEIAGSCRSLRKRVEDILAAEAFPLVVGGDHSIAVGTVAAISSFHHRRGRKIGLLWFDAHGDFSTPETSPSGNIHGMACAVCLGRGAPGLVQLGDCVPMVSGEKTAIVGARSVGYFEREEIKATGARVFTMHDIDMLGMNEVMRRALAVVNDDTEGFHLSFDMDGIDPSIAPGTDTPVEGGPSLREAHLVMEHAARSGRLLGLEITEINPFLDERNRTAELAVQLVLSALGKRML